jgi:hypothetical protein
MDTPLLGNLGGLGANNPLPMTHDPMALLQATEHSITPINTHSIHLFPKKVEEGPPQVVL